MIVAKIEKDYINDDGSTRQGWEWTLDQINRKIWGEPIWLDEIEDAPKVMFRLRDEDMTIHYGGWLLNDPEAVIQEVMAHWGAADTGGFIIEVKYPNTDEWVMEIG